MAQKRNEQGIIITHSQQEITRLRIIEQEYQELQRQIYNNSPPASTQLPKEIREKLILTPKSPAISLGSDTLSMIETPNKTPKSILRQPGSAAKRHRVLFTSPSQEKFDISLDQALDVNDENDNSEIKNVIVKTSPCFTSTTTLKEIEMHLPDKNFNIRKTPRRSTRRFTDEPSIKIEKNWFDCEQIFGFGIDD